MHIFPLRPSFAMSNGNTEPSHHCRVGMAEPLAWRSWLFLLPMLAHPLPQSIIHPQLFLLSMSAVEIAHLLLLPVPCAESSQLLPQRTFFIQCTQLARDTRSASASAAFCLLDRPRGGLMRAAFLPLQRTFLYGSHSNPPKAPILPTF